MACGASFRGKDNKCNIIYVYMIQLAQISGTRFNLLVISPSRKGAANSASYIVFGLQIFGPLVPLAISMDTSYKRYKVSALVQEGSED
jgi:hypothetical protein